jgi:hypothetical protein
VAQGSRTDDFQNIGPYSPTQYELALKEGKELTKAQRYALAVTAYQRGSKDPEVQKLLVEWLKDPEAKWKAGELPRFIIPDRWQPNAADLDSIFSLAAASPVSEEQLKFHFHFLFYSGWSKEPKRADEIAKVLSEYLDSKGGKLTAKEREMALAMVREGQEIFKDSPVASLAALETRLGNAKAAVALPTGCAAGFARISAGK